MRRKVAEGELLAMGALGVLAKALNPQAARRVTADEFLAMVGGA